MIGQFAILFNIPVTKIEGITFQWESSPLTSVSPVRPIIVLMLTPATVCPVQHRLLLQLWGCSAEGPPEEPPQPSILIKLAPPTNARTAASQANLFVCHPLFQRCIVSNPDSSPETSSPQRNSNSRQKPSSNQQRRISRPPQRFITFTTIKVSKAP